VIFVVDVSLKLIVDIAGKKSYLAGLDLIMIHKAEVIHKLIFAKTVIMISKNLREVP